MDIKQFVELVIKRGYGIYGKEKIEKMAKEAGISVSSSGVSINGNVDAAAKKFFSLYSKTTPVAAMNLKMMAKMNKIKL